jgi:hypothetical protein
MVRADIDKNRKTNVVMLMTGENMKTSSMADEEEGGGVEISPYPPF